MKEIRKVLQSLLETVHPRTFYQIAPEGAEMPYLIYDITGVVDDGEGFQTVAVDVDGWDMPAGGDSTALESLMSSVDAVINKRTVAAEDLAVAFYLDRKIALLDDEKRFIRRKYIYEGRLFGRS